MKEKLLGFVSGVAFGVASVVPGLSGGTMLVICGTYDMICKVLALDFKTIKKNWLFLIIFAAGLAAGVMGLANLITFMLDTMPLVTYLLLAALVLSGLPIVMRKIKAANKKTVTCVISALLGCALVVSLFIAEMLGSSGAADTPGTVKLVVFSSFAGFSSIIPGVSGSFVLVMLGIYEYVIVAVKELNFSVLLFAGIGIVIGLVGGSRLVTFLLKKAQAPVYSAIAGMLTGSAVMLVINSLIKYTDIM